MVEERRQHQRVVPNAPLFISLDDSKSGLLLDLCEGGLAVASLVPRNIDDVVSLAFDLPEGERRIEAKARIAWTRDSGHLTGVHFVELGEQSQRQLNDWISAGMNLRMAVTQEPPEPTFVTRSSYAQVDSIAQLPRAVSAPEPPAPTMLSTLAAPANLESEAFEVIDPPEPAPEPGKPGKSRYTMELFLAVVLLSWALVFLGYQMGSTGASRQTHEVTAASRVTETSPSRDLANAAALPQPTPLAAPATALASATPKVASTATAASRPMSMTRVPTRASAPAPEPKPMRTVASMDSGVILQVGAMRLEDNAAALAQDLRKRNFPAVVFRHGNEKLYRVAVGPYSDADTSGKIKEQLEKQGFKPFVQRWVRD
jgi:cell division septation protein DedD